MLTKKLCLKYGAIGCAPNSFSVQMPFRTESTYLGMPVIWSLAQNVRNYPYLIHAQNVEGRQQINGLT